MKNTIYILSILILFQGCYSYKVFDIKEYETITPKKVKIELKDSRKIKGEVIEFKSDRLIIDYLNDRIEIPFLKIIKIKQGKFSLLKTGGFIATTLITTDIAMSTILTFTISK
ncbi:MAG: hypothetical protein V3V28_06065 [Polaribacter sp.]|uniref:hypothetical protein n=1 Tax=Polaribacter sp. TaxID=1920175 RepID=UPI002F3528FD